MSYDITMPWYTSKSQPNLGGVGNVGASAMLEYAGESNGRDPQGNILMNISPAAKRRWASEDVAQQEYLKQHTLDMEQQKQRMSMLQALLSAFQNGGSPTVASPFSSGALGSVDENYRAGDMQGLMNRYNMALDPNSSPNQLLRDQAMAGLQSSFATGMRDLRGTMGRGSPPQTNQARLADMLNSRLMAQKDIESKLALDAFNRRDSLMGALGGLMQGDISTRQGAQQQNISNNMQAANMNMQASIANANIQAQQRQQLMAQLSAMMGGGR
jgi:hypothetical protein